MPAVPLSEEAAEALLSGHMAPADAPPGWAGVAAAFRIASGPPTEDELAGMESVVAACVEAIRARPGKPGDRPRGRRSRRVLAVTPWTAAVGAAALFGTTAAAAAAAGYIPGRDLLLPRHHGSASAATVARPTPAGAESYGRPGADAVDRAMDPTHQRRYCTGFLVAMEGAPGTAPLGYQGLIAAHGGVPATTMYCEGVTGGSVPTGSSGRPPGTTGAAAAVVPGAAKGRSTVSGSTGTADATTTTAKGNGQGRGNGNGNGQANGNGNGNGQGNGNGVGQGNGNGVGQGNGNSNAGGQGKGSGNGKPTGQTNPVGTGSSNGNAGGQGSGNPGGQGNGNGNGKAASTPAAK